MKSTKLCWVVRAACVRSWTDAYKIWVETPKRRDIFSVSYSTKDSPPCLPIQYLNGPFQYYPTLYASAFRKPHSFGLSHQSSVSIYCLAHACHTPGQAHINYYSNIWWRVQIVTLSPHSFWFLTLRSQMSSSATYLRKPSAYVLCVFSETKFHTHKITEIIFMVLYILISVFLDSKR